MMVAMRESLFVLLHSSTLSPQPSALSPQLLPKNPLAFPIFNLLLNPFFLFLPTHLPLYVIPVMSSLSMRLRIDLSYQDWMLWVEGANFASEQLVCLDSPHPLSSAFFCGRGSEGEFR